MHIYRVNSGGNPGPCIAMVSYIAICIIVYIHSWTFTPSGNRLRRSCGRRRRLWQQLLSRCRSSLSVSVLCVCECFAVLLFYVCVSSLFLSCVLCACDLCFVYTCGSFSNAMTARPNMAAATHSDPEPPKGTSTHTYIYSYISSNEEGLRGRARCVAPRAFADAASAAWSWRDLAVGRWRGERFGRYRCLTWRYNLLLSVWVDPSAEHISVVIYIYIHSRMSSQPDIHGNEDTQPYMLNMRSED